MTTPEIARLDLPTHTVSSAPEAGRAMLEDSLQRFGFVPNLYANMVNVPGLLETYFLSYQRLRESIGFTPVEQEVVFLTISRFHGCTYCMAAHSMIGDKMSKVPADVLQALRDGRALPDAKLEALATFTTVMVDSRGAPSPEQLAAFKAAGYTDRDALEIVLAIACKVISNYTNHLFATETDAAFAGYAWKG